MRQAFDFDLNGHLVPSKFPTPRLSPKASHPQKGPANSHRSNLLPFPILPEKPSIDKLVLDHTRDQLLNDFSKATLTDRYLLPGESYQDLFARVSCAYADDQAHAQRLYDAMARLWFLPATPILSNGGTKRGLPISCFLNSVDDSLTDIVATWNENIWLAAHGGGIGTYWGNLRSVGEQVTRAGTTSGIIPFLHVTDSLTLAISQGSLRRGNAAAYLDIHHPEIEEFLEIRKPSGDFNRKCLNLHQGINITDAFMKAVYEDTEFALVSPKTKETVRTVSARHLFQKILETRLQTGEPYLIFIDSANKALPKHQKELGLSIEMSNLCSEILLPTGADHLGNKRTAVCCLSSLNAENWLEWCHEEHLIEDILRFLDNVLESFIQTAPDSMAQAKYSALRERSVGLGFMGWHSFLQSQNIPFESAIAKSYNMKMFRHIRRAADAASVKLAIERGSCLDAKERGIMARFSHKLAIAPTASISIICGGTSACVEPIPANIYIHKTLSGSYVVKNKYLQRLLKLRKLDTEATWQYILSHEGSVQELEGLSANEKAVFKTAFEIDQRWLIDFAADRAPLICQGQSLNLYLSAEIPKWDLLMLHWEAWRTGIKSLYYCRSKSVRRAEFINAEVKLAEMPLSVPPTDYSECLACQ
jgi:ribonucleoside-diphosphate reductase alpha chain